MSLLTNFQSVQNKIVQANNIAESLWDTSRFIGHNENQWRFTKYNGNKGSSTYQPTLADVTGKTPNNTYFKNDGYSGNFNVGDYYTGLVECWVHCLAATNLSVTGTNDDYGAIYLNDTLQFRINTVGSVTGTVKFVKGWNHFQYVFYEHTGNDCAYINKTLHTQSFIDKMYAYGEKVIYNG